METSGRRVLPMFLYTYLSKTCSCLQLQLEGIIKWGRNKVICQRSATHPHLKICRLLKLNESENFSLTKGFYLLIDNGFVRLVESSSFTTKGPCVCVSVCVCVCVLYTPCANTSQKKTWIDMQQIINNQGALKF